ncbi:MAG: NrtR DNA-binding winged helix domain-containing protein [Oscillospiraceae bacterium]
MPDEKEFLKSYNIKKYEQPSAAADIAVFTVKNIPDENYRKLDGKKLCLLMIRRGKPPFQDYYALPGGFAKKDETVDNTALRELFEETSVENIYLSQLKTTSTPGRDPRGWIISCGYLALVDSTKLSVKSGDDASDARWFEVGFTRLSCEMLANQKITRYRLELLNGENRLSADITEKITLGASGREYSVTAENSKGIAFDHAEIIAYALTELRRKTIYEGAAFSLLPEYFTMTELQQVYETIMDVKESDANFRRKMSGYVLLTDETQGGMGHRPSKLYKRNIEAFLNI